MLINSGDNYVSILEPVQHAIKADFNKLESEASRLRAENKTLRTQLVSSSSPSAPLSLCLHFHGIMHPCHCERYHLL
jgi:hypothetical protein